MIYLTRTHANSPEPGKGIRIAIFQAERPVGTVEAVTANLDRLEEAVQDVKAKDVHLISFPELYITGYTMSREVMHDLAETFDGPSMTRVSEIAKSYGVAIICPYAEKEEREDGIHYYDSIAFVGADGALLHNYRKTHLFGMAERRNYDFGYVENPEEAFQVHEVNGMPVGVLNCYEAEFFELARILALKGAKLIMIPTAADYYYNLTDGTPTTVPYPDISKNLIPAHAYENSCFVTYCNRSGAEHVGEGTWEYRGNSIICGPHGDTLVAARNEDTLLIADCVPGDYSPTHPEGHYLKNRRPELYGELVKMKVDFEGGYEYQNPPERDKDH